MHNRQLNFQSSHRRSRLLVAVVTAVALLAASGLFLAPAQAQGPAQFVFQGSGWGHGVGMSQNGARNLADSGGNHVQILNFYYPNTVISEIEPLDNIRVHLGDASRVEFSSAGSMVFSKGDVAINAVPSGSITVSAHDGGLQIGNAWTTGTPSDPLIVSFPQPVTLSNNGHRYLWGKMQITNRDGEVRVVEVLPLEDYVAGIAEMPAAWPLEALMAQAIAARTYAHEITLHRRNSAEWAQEYDISGSTVDQNYIGYDAQDSAWDQKWLAAVKSTARATMIDSNGPVRAYYSATNGGYTETAAYVFKNDVAHTVAGPDPYDAGGHDWTNWTRTYSQESMSRWLNASADTSVGTVTSITVGEGAGASGRIDNAVVEIVGTGGTKQVTGRRLMLVINAGIFGEGGGLSTHLPGTFTTIGNGAGAGFPISTGISIAPTITPDPLPEGVSINDGFTPPPGWKPEPGTGVAPRSSVDNVAEAAPDAVAPLGTLDADGTFTPPEGWVPEPGSGVAPSTTNASQDTSAAQADGTFSPPEGWVPEPGTGVAPTAAPAETSSAASTGDAVQTTPEGYVPEPGTGVAPNTTDSAAAVPVEVEATTFTPPEGWVPEPGTGRAPNAASQELDTATVGGTGGGDALASGVLLVTRTAEGTELTEATFEVISPTEDLAAEARARLEALQANAALGLFADVDIDGYVASVAPRPVHGVCTATASGVTCVPIEALRD